MATDAADFIPTIEVCTALDVDRATLVRWVARGIAKPAMKLPGRGGAYLFERAEIARLRDIRGDRKQMPRESAVAS